MTQGDDRAAAEIALLRKDSDDGGTAVGYDNQGRIVEVKGDDDAPFGKAPPFPSTRDTLFEGVAPIAAYIETEEMDCEGIHVVTLYVRYTNPTLGARLSIIPQVRESAVAPFEPIGVVDAALTTLVPLGETSNYLSRTIGPAEFRTVLLPQNDGVVEASMQLAVGPYFQIRFRLLTVGVGTDGDAVLRANGSD